MHRSKLSTFVIDCKTDDLSAAARFWSAALRRKVAPAKPDAERYRDLVCAPEEPLLMLQQVSHESRIHLDIESEDIPAEVARLEALGARALERIHTWVVMEAPTGQRFCVVRPQRPGHTPPPFDAKPEHEALSSLAGHYKGTTRTFLDPNGAPVESEDTLYIAPVLGGRFVRIQWYGSVGDKPRQGELTLGYHVDAQEHELSWVDTFHTGSAILQFRGKPSDDGSIDVLGSYAAGEQRWGFGFTFARRGDGIVMRAINVSPAGEKQRAIETDWEPVHPGGIDDF
jgi:hypothetical protein